MNTQYRTGLAMMLFTTALVGQQMKLTVQAETPEGGEESLFEVECKQGKLSGFYTGGLGHQPLTGTCEGEQITMRFTGVWPAGGGDVEVTLSGKVADGAGKGTLVVKDRTEGTWTAKVMREAPTAAKVQAGDSKAAGTLVATIANVKSSSGVIRAALFLGAEGFPNDWNRKLTMMERPAQQGSMELRFDGLKAGDYAVVVVHDENNNGVLDKNEMGIPTEGFGSSNGSGALAAPQFEQAKVSVAAGEAATKIVLHY